MYSYYTGLEKVSILFMTLFQDFSRFDSEFFEGLLMFLVILFRPLGTLGMEGLSVVHYIGPEGNGIVAESATSFIVGHTDLRKMTIREVSQPVNLY